MFSILVFSLFHCDKCTGPTLSPFSRLPPATVNRTDYHATRSELSPEGRQNSTATISDIDYKTQVHPDTAAKPGRFRPFNSTYCCTLGGRVVVRGAVYELINSTYCCTLGGRVVVRGAVYKKHAAGPLH